MNPKLDMYFLHSLYGQLYGFHSLILLLNERTLVNCFNSKSTISQILGPKLEVLSLPWKKDLTFGITNSELIRKLKFMSCR